MGVIYKYALDNGIEGIYTQTWSENIRVIGLMKKLGFEECNCEKGFRIVRGKPYDGLTFKLNIRKYKELWRSTIVFNEIYCTIKTDIPWGGGILVGLTWGISSCTD